jgi:hypothetical protein
VVAKTLFSMCTEEVNAAFDKLPGVKKVLIVGIETHVCVLQTSLDLLGALGGGAHARPHPASIMCCRRRLGLLALCLPRPVLLCMLSVNPACPCLLFLHFQSVATRCMCWWMA